MKHYIIVKFKDSITLQEQEGLRLQIARLFEPATRLGGVHEVSLYPALLRSDKRYDLMICMDMEKEALDAFDHSDIHCLWKERFSGFIAHKAIFDCE